jgi:hypothetical protein
MKEGIMSMLAFFAIAAMLGAVFSLACGVAAMISNEEVLRLRSEQWMGWRVAWHAAAVLFAAAFLATAAYGEALPRAECVYDYPMITAEECRTYRADMLAAQSDEERLALRGTLHEVMEARAGERGVTVDDWRGLSLAPPADADAPLSGPRLAAWAALGAIVAVALLVLRTLMPLRDTRLMRCPETGGIAFVGAERLRRGEATAAGLRVTSCDLWPDRKDCARECLARYAETAPGFLVNVGTLRPFERPSPAREAS